MWCSFNFFWLPWAGMNVCFFFQAEDGIRHPLVTGVQTCALPILVEHGEHAHQPSHGKALVVAPQDVRQIELFNANELGGGGLCQLATFDQPVKLNDKRAFELMFLGVGEAKVGEDVAAADFVGGQSLLAHALTPFVALWMV